MRLSMFSALLAEPDASRLGMRELLADAIADLPGRERLVFTLYYHEELETSEIALVLGDTVFAVIQLHVSALRRLKARLVDPRRSMRQYIGNRMKHLVAHLCGHFWPQLQPGRSGA
jgi:DNA-directed RNA polymerase specialized sigma24 family protein